MSQSAPEVLFHKTISLYAPGDVIVPGNYGRVVLGTGVRHSSFFREQILEAVRSKEFKGAPSRLSSAYAFTDVDAAEAFAPDAFPNLYSVTLAEESSPRHSADMAWLDRLAACHTFQGVEACARGYWSGEVLQSSTVETLTTSALIVVERLTLFEDERLSAAGQVAAPKATDRTLEGGVS